jgi:uncharacterized protein
MRTSADIIEQTISYVKQELANAEGGHDWFHIERVWKSAKTIAQTEQSDILVVELGALLHDIADSKFNGGDEELGPQKAEAFLTSLSLSDDIIQQVVFIIRNISFKGGNNLTTQRTLELDIVQDADRLDAIGAIGIARAFNYGGFKNRELYNPAIKPNLNMSKEEYKNSNAPTLNHFYEKLLLLKDLMNTASGKKLAAQRHEFMEHYITQFYNEWDGKA